jgi:hypothetical protein
VVSTPGTGIAEGDTMGSRYHHSTFVVSLCGANGRLVACSVCIQNEFTSGCKSGLAGNHVIWNNTLGMFCIL